MSSLEQIQADILFLSREKQSFFSRLFNSNTERINDLRILEKKVIASLLYENNDQYRNLSDENTALLGNTHWSLKIIDCDNAGKSFYYTNHIEAVLEMKGFLHGKGIAYYFTLPERSPEFSYINSLGEFRLYNAEQFLESGTLPGSFECYTDNKGRVTVEKAVQKSSTLYARIIIKNVIGDPFNGNSAKRKTFLKNRLDLLELIRKQVILP